MARSNIGRHISRRDFQRGTALTIAASRELRALPLHRMPHP